MIQAAWIGGTLSLIAAAVFYACCIAGARSDERDTEIHSDQFPVPGYPFTSHATIAGSHKTASGGFVGNEALNTLCSHDAGDSA